MVQAEITRCPYLKMGEQIICGELGISLTMKNVADRKEKVPLATKKCFLKINGFTNNYCEVIKKFPDSPPDILVSKKSELFK